MAGEKEPRSLRRALSGTLTLGKLRAPAPSCSCRMKSSTSVHCYLSGKAVWWLEVWGRTRRPRLLLKQRRILVRWCWVASRKSYHGSSSTWALGLGGTALENVWEERKKTYKRRWVKEGSCLDRRKAKNRQKMLDVSMGAQSLMVWGLTLMSSWLNKLKKYVDPVIVAIKN